MIPKLSIGMPTIGPRPCFRAQQNEQSHDVIPSASEDMTTFSNPTTVSPGFGRFHNYYGRIKESVHGLHPYISQSTTDIISRQLSSRVSIMAQTLFLRGVVRDSIITLATNTMFDIVAYVWGAIGRAFSRHCMVTAHFDSTNEAYEWVMDWFTEQSYAKRTTDVCVGIESQRLESGFGVVAKPKYEPGPGLHVLTYKGRLLLVNRSDVAVNTSGTRQNSITLRIMGTSRSIIEQLVEEARTQAQTKSQGKTAVFLGDQYGSWNRVATRAKRPLSSVLLARGLADGLYQDAREFMHSEEWYRDRGIPYRRGYLLYGPPGNGKSSIVMALAGALNLNIYVVNISAPSLTDELLSDLLCGSAPDRCILLLEDVDHAFNAAADGSTDESTNVKSSSVTFSGLLNAIDGVAAQEGRLLILTTNNPEKLAPALIRPGRIDVRCYLPYATPSMMYRMFENFYSGQEGVQDMAREFVRGVMAAILTLGPNECPKNRCKWDPLSVEPWFGEHVLSPSVGDSEWAANVCQGDCMNQYLPMALIQGFLMKYKTSPGDAIDNCSDFVKDDKHQTAASLTGTHSAVL